VGRRRDRVGDDCPRVTQVAVGDPVSAGQNGMAFAVVVSVNRERGSALVRTQSGESGEVPLVLAEVARTTFLGRVERGEVVEVI
jgi:hypothetical protein